MKTNIKNLFLLPALIAGLGLIPAGRLTAQTNVSTTVIAWGNNGNGLVSGLQIYLSVPPPNDNFANRTILTGSNISTNGNNAGASQESGEPYDISNYGYGHKSVWFSWTAPTTGSRVISVSTPSVYYPILAIYTGSQLSSLSKVTDTFPGGYYASYAISAVAGQTYQIEIDDDGGNGGTYTLSIAP